LAHKTCVMPGIINDRPVTVHVVRPKEKRRLQTQSAVPCKSRLLLQRTHSNDARQSGKNSVEAVELPVVLRKQVIERDASLIAVLFHGVTHSGN
jgi:hypothetical protein